MFVVAVGRATGVWHRLYVDRRLSMCRRKRRPGGYIGYDRKAKKATLTLALIQILLALLTPFRPFCFLVTPGIYTVSHEKRYLIFLCNSPFLGVFLHFVYQLKQE